MSRGSVFRLPTCEDVLWQQAVACLIAQREDVPVGQDLLPLLDVYDGPMRLLEELAFHQRFCATELTQEFVRRIAIRIAEYTLKFTGPGTVAGQWLEQCVSWELLQRHRDGSGQVSYAFTIPTLDEYFAARALARRWGELEAVRDSEDWTEEHTRNDVWLPGRDRWWETGEGYRCGRCGQDLPLFAEIVKRGEHRNILLLFMGVLNDPDQERLLLEGYLTVLEERGKGIGLLEDPRLKKRAWQGGLEMLAGREESIGFLLASLSRCRFEHSEVVQTLVPRMLRQPRWQASHLAVLVRARCPENLECMVVELIVALSDEDEEFCYQAANVLVEIGKPAVISLIAVLDAEKDCLRAASAWVLGQIGDARAVPPLIATLSKNDESFESGAGFTVWVELALHSKWALHSNRYFYSLPALALLRIGAPSLLPLTTALSDIDEYVRAGAAWSLCEMSRHYGNAREHNVWEGQFLGHSFDAIATFREVTFDPLMDALGDENAYVRSYAAEALGNIGDARAVKALITAMSDEDEDVRLHAAIALGNIGDARAVKALITALEDENAVVCNHVAKALKQIRQAR